MATGMSQSSTCLAIHTTHISHIFQQPHLQFPEPRQLFKPRRELGEQSVVDCELLDRLREHACERARERLHVEIAQQHERHLRLRREQIGGERNVRDLTFPEVVAKVASACDVPDGYNITRLRRSRHTRLSKQESTHTEVVVLRSLSASIFSSWSLLVHV